MELENKNLREQLSKAKDTIISLQTQMIELLKNDKKSMQNGQEMVLKALFKAEEPVKKREQVPVQMNNQ